MLCNLLMKQTAVLHLQNTLVLKHDVDHGAVPVDGRTVLICKREPAFHQLPLVQLVHSEDALQSRKDITASESAVMQVPFPPVRNVG